MTGFGMNPEFEQNIIGIVMTKYLKAQTDHFLKMSILLLVVSINASSQGIIISQGSSFSVSGGFVSLTGNLVNNGSFNDNNGTLILRGGTLTISGTTPVLFNNLTIDAGTTATITTPGQYLSNILLCNGILNSNGYLTLGSSETRTALIDGRGTGQVNGNVTMQRYIASGFGYKYFSSPFLDAHVSELSDNLKLDEDYPALWKYDESKTVSGWVSYVEPDSPLNPFEGYALNMGSTGDPLTLDITGVVNNGTVSVNLYNHNNLYTEGFSLAGNPYPSPVDWDSQYGWTRVNIDNALYYFEASTTDEYGGAYVTYLNGVSSNGLATNIIPSMQGFFVHVSDGSFPVSGSMSVTNEARIPDLTHPMVKSEEPQKPLLRLSAAYKEDNLSTDPLVVYFDDKASFSFDGQLDALKLMNTDYMMVNFYLISPDNKKLSISAMPFLTDSVYRAPLGLMTGYDGNIIFSVRNLEGDLSKTDIFLSDIITGSVTDLKTKNSYEIFLPAGEYENRFFLDFRNLNTGIDVIKNPGESLFNVYQSNDILKLTINHMPSAKGRFTLLNLAGQVLLTGDFTSPGSYELECPFKSGIYIACFSSGIEKESKKLFIKNH